MTASYLRFIKDLFWKKLNSQINEERTHENKTRNVYFPMTVKKILVLWKYSKFVLGLLTELANCSQNKLEKL